MRLIGQLEDEKQAFVFSNFLTSQGIDNHFEPYLQQYGVWVENEDDADAAIIFFDEFKKNPEAPEFLKSQDKPIPSSFNPKKSNWKVKLNIQPKISPFTVTNLFLAICIMIFVWNWIEEIKIAEENGVVATQVSLPPIAGALLFDYTPSMAALTDFVKGHDLKNYKSVTQLPEDCMTILQEGQNLPTWKGVYDLMVHWKQRGWNYVKNVTMFEKIRQGEVWRLFTPALLHFDFLHILFNMIWLWILGKQIESRIGKMRLLTLILLTAIISNIAQYIMTGPLFLGFSGVVIGMAGFIWMRQKMAPWEGYPLQRGVALFILFFVLAMIALDIVVFVLEVSSLVTLTPIIANTAHVVGGLTGILCARIPYFFRKTA